MTFPLLLLLAPSISTPTLSLAALLITLSTILHTQSHHLLSIAFSPTSSNIVFLSGIILLLTLCTSPIRTIPHPSLALLSLTLIILFTIQNTTLFYIMFEATTLPIAGVVIGWGPQPERLTATTYMFFYALSSSLPLLLSILGMYRGYFWSTTALPTPFAIVISIPFLVKTPMYLFHLWLPKAHVEAPVYGSMVLAGVLLNIGAYGIWKFLVPHPTPEIKMIAPITLIGGLYAAIATCTQEDINSIIAYSSVVHISLALFALCSTHPPSITPTNMMLVSHGLASSGLFFVSWVGYSSSGSRSLLLSCVPLWSTPSVVLSWSILIIMNLGVPPSLNFFSEVLLLTIPIMSSWLWAVGVVVLVVCVVIYSILLYIAGSHGMPSTSKSSLPPSNIKDLASAMYHSVWLCLGPLSLTLFE